jgi:hypothetical protein
MYEYKSILLEGTYDEPLTETHCDTLNEYFEDGWEYVDSIAQNIAQGSNGTEFGPIIVVLKKKRDSTTL